ncbi:MAG TPA: lysylphosphatidylglycerol synthase transmembrane domain-containing protein, partial [Kofleriaceae bacterium]|nr:lysylphosphatidylglycerol synthase transmembrane domain-containing protein [Kofleriaceae bacterium]
VLAAGMIGLVVVLYHLGWDGTRRAVVGTGAWFAVIAAIDLASVFCDSFAIHGFLRNSAPVSYWPVFGAEASGIAINRLTPGNSLGEPVKVTMLVRQVPVNLAVAAVVMFNLVTMYVAMTAIVIGVPVTALLLDLPEPVALAVWIATAVIVVVAIAVALIVRRGAVGTLIDAVVGLRIVSIERADRWRVQIAEIDGRLRQLGDTKSSGLARGIAGVVGSRILNWTGTVVILHALDIPMTPALVVASMSAGLLVTWMSNVIPLGLGIADGTNYALYGLLGASPEAGLLFTMVNRLRTCMLAMMGLTIMGIANRAARA